MIYIKDMQRGQVREYGTNGHDSLHLSLDGRTLTYENLQNGDGSSCGDYRICDNPNGILPEDMKSPESVYTYVDIGGNSLNSTSYDRGYADGTADEYHAIMDILNRCGVTVCMEDKQLITIAEYVERKYREERNEN